jgi:hypothetical protein
MKGVALLRATLKNEARDLGLAELVGRASESTEDDEREAVGRAARSGLPPHERHLGNPEESSEDGAREDEAFSERGDFGGAHDRERVPG